MSYAFDSRLGKQLYQLLPEVYRTRDKTLSKDSAATNNSHLAKFLDAHGHLLDLIHATLEQQLKDTLPETSQDWLLPYFAELLAVNIVSPDSQGKHAEVANAVTWRQRKGTLKCVEDIAEAVGHMEVELQEGWKRVAITAKIGMPIMPAKAWDNTLTINKSSPADAARHPALPAAMVDLRRASRAMDAEPENPAARRSTFSGITTFWHQVNRHGVACFPGSFDDVSRRTVDIRTPDAVNGRYHPKRLLVFTPPPSGLFPEKPIELAWLNRNNPEYEHLIEDMEENGKWIIRNKTRRVIEITDAVVLSPSKPCFIEGINFSNRLHLKQGSVELHRVEAKEVQVDTVSTEKPVLTATDCLFDELSVGAGVAWLNSCTVISKAFLVSINAIDCIFMAMSGVDISGVLQYSRIPGNPPIDTDNMTIEDCVSDVPVFFKNQVTLNAKAVLSPATVKSIYAGASDKGEMGYFHSGRQAKPVRIRGNFTGPSALTLPESNDYALSDVVFEGNVEIKNGSLELVRSAVKSITVTADIVKDDNNNIIPSLLLTDCVFDLVSVTNGLVRMEYCTVMKQIQAKQLQASDCIFIGSISNGSGSSPESGCIRYSRIPEGFDGTVVNISNTVTGNNTRERPAFITLFYCNDDGSYIKREPQYGEPGYAVLNLVSSEAIRFGAEDANEMGAYHHKYYSLKQNAVIEKIREFVPVGIEPILIHDAHLLNVPAKQINSDASMDIGEGP